MTKVVAPHIAIMRESIAAIDGYRPPDRTAFLANPMLQDAVLMRLQVIGEHVARIRHLDEERFGDLADPSWPKVISLRTIIAHGTPHHDIFDPSGPAARAGRCGGIPIRPLHWPSKEAARSVSEQRWSGARPGRRPWATRIPRADSVLLEHRGRP